MQKKEINWVNSRAKKVNQNRELCAVITLSTLLRLKEKVEIK